MDMIHAVFHYKPCAYVGDCACISSKHFWIALIIETGIVLEIIQYYYPVEVLEAAQICMQKPDLRKQKEHIVALRLYL